MKFPTTASILAFGLVLVNSVAASNCRPSKAASISPSLSSSAPSSSSSPTEPVCTNVVTNGDFAEGATGWTLTGSNSFSAPCLGVAGCDYAAVSSDFTTSFTQALSTEVGTTYNFNIDFYPWNLVGNNNAVCTLTDSSGVTTYTIPLDQFISGGWTESTGQLRRGRPACRL
ncbi:hypothetical protein SCUCBS95973_003023 [Sporothrix curviconia]|uniref:AA1-like domain-containing protein n=1 Tax=Sporothrix curviconia TaxID=1260050 RepID=A0ABP0BBV6_9PEZI